MGFQEGCAVRELSEFADGEELVQEQLTEKERIVKTSLYFGRPYRADNVFGCRSSEEQYVEPEQKS